LLLTMCGINGIFSYGPAAPPPDSAELLRTRDAMARRGPDGAGEWRDAGGRCLLGHRRLSIIDLDDRAAQPMTGADDRYTISFNGEIYNYRALRDTLEAEGYVFRTTSDTEVIIALFARDGAAMLPQLRGMFALAIWDAVARRLFLARDAFGIKPLYLSAAKGVFRFASQVKALLAGGAIDPAPDPAAIIGFHLMGSVPEPFTMVRAISALPAGHSLWVDAGGMRTPECWANIAQDIVEWSNEQPRGSIEDCLRLALNDSVAAHLVADVEVEALERVATTLREKGVEVLAVPTDVSDAAAVERVPLPVDTEASLRSQSSIQR